MSTSEDPTYPCEKCGKPRNRAGGGTTLTACDECWDGPGEVRTMVMSWRVEHYRVKGLEVFPAFESHIYDPVVMLQCAHCLKAYGAETISTIPRHRESLEAEIEALKADTERMKSLWAERGKMIAHAKAEVNRLRDVLIERDAEVARLEGLIVRNNLCTKPTAESCARNCAESELHAEARAIKARQGA